MAIAYYQLSDLDMSRKYYEKDIKKRSKDLTIFKTQLDTIKQGAYSYEQQSISIILPMFFRALITDIKETGSFEQSDLIDLADSFFQSALLSEESSSDVDAIIAYISSLSLYISKSLNDVNQLTTDVNNLLNLFTDGDLKVEKIIEVSKGLLSVGDRMKIHLKIASMYRDDQMDDVEDLDGDDDTSNESRMISLQWYTDLLNNTTDVFVKSVCFYNILIVYKEFIHEDNHGKSIVDQMIDHLPKLAFLDRRLLIELTLDFLKEYDNNTDKCDMKINRQLTKMAKDALEEKVQLNEENNIGHYLKLSNDLNGAAKYWKSISEQLESDIPNQILTLARQSYSTFDQILQAINQSKDNTILLVHRLIDTYETMADYYVLDAKNNTTNRIQSFREAQDLYEKALDLFKHLNDNSNNQIKTLQRKQQDVIIEVNKKTIK